ncbi:MAG TPA: DUF2064 domain-containing protein [Thermoanaerobaculia bacterium]
MYTGEGMRQTPNPTLLVFTLGAARESARRSLVPGELRGLEIGLREGCLAAALDAGRGCGCRLEVSSSARLALPPEVSHVPQPGADFGDRLARAMDAAFARGAGPLLVVGTDVPGLSAEPLREALDLLADEPNRVVLGPSPDGGLYLLAACRPIAGLATAVRWCGRAALGDLLRHLEAAGRPVVLLTPLADLDRPSDLDGWISRAGADARWRGLARLLRQALAGRRRPLVPAALGGPRFAFSPVYSGRAPPAPPSR